MLLRDFLSSFLLFLHKYITLIIFSYHFVVVLVSDINSTAIMPNMFVVFIAFISLLHSVSSFSLPSSNIRRVGLYKKSSLFSSENDQRIEETDVIVVGSGFGGLCCAALTSKYNLNTICVEAHDTPGGVAHSFSRYNNKASTSKEESKIPFRFDSGPSLISGLSSKSTNPLRQVLDAIGVADDIE